MANPTQGGPPPIQGGHADLQIDVQENADADIQIDVQERRDDVHLGVRAGRLIPPDQIVTDFPDSHTSSGNTMKCLEQALLDAAGQGHLTGREREAALTNLRQGVTKISGKLLKENDRADSSVVADTYRGIDGQKYYKFLVTWEIDVTINGEQKTIRKSQWTVTGVKQPTDFRDPKTVRESHQFALLALKCHRHINKAGMNPKHQDYTYVRDCINDVRNTNLLAPNNWGERLAFTSQLLATEYEGDSRSYALEDTIEYGQAANSLGITLKRDDGKKLNVYIDTAHQTREIDETGRKYIKGVTDLQSELPEGVTTAGQKHLRQGQLMAIRGNPDIDNYLDIIQAKPDEVNDRLEKMRFVGTNDRGMTFSQVKDELLAARKEQAKIHKRNAKFAGMKFNHTLLQIYGPRIGDSKTKAVKLMLKQEFYGDHKMAKSLIKELQGENLSADERRRLQQAMDELANANDNLRDSQAAVAVQKHDALTEFVEQTEPLTYEEDGETMYDINDQALELLDASAPDPMDIPDSTVVKRNDQLLQLAGNLLT